MEEGGKGYLPRDILRWGVCRCPPLLSLPLLSLSYSRRSVIGFVVVAEFTAAAAVAFTAIAALVILAIAAIVVLAVTAVVASAAAPVGIVVVVSPLVVVSQLVVVIVGSLLGPPLVVVVCLHFPHPCGGLATLKGGGVLGACSKSSIGCVRGAS